jgi:hypothetical protein
MPFYMTKEFWKDCKARLDNGSGWTLHTQKRIAEAIESAIAGQFRLVPPIDPIGNATLEELDTISAYGSGTIIGGNRYYPKDAFDELMRRHRELLEEAGPALE